MFRNPYADGLIVLVVLLLFFGPKRLPTLGRSLGQGLREFKESITGNSTDEDEDDRPEIAKASAPVAEASAVPSPEAAPAPQPAAPAPVAPAPTATPADHAG